MASSRANAAEAGRGRDGLTRRPGPVRQPCRYAFTLVELLVVISILSLLMSILVPMLGSAKEQTRTTACLTNLKGIGTAVQFYANDYDGWIVPFYVVDGEVVEMWYTLLMHTRSVSGKIVTDEQIEQRKVGAIGDTIFECPSGTADVDDLTGWNLNVFGRRAMATAPSFFKSVSLAGEGRRVVSHYGGNGDGCRGYFPMSMIARVGAGGALGVPWTHTRCTMDNVRNAAMLVGVYDGVWTHNRNRWNLLKTPHRYLTRANLMMLDGHAETAHPDDLPPEGQPGVFVEFGGGRAPDDMNAVCPKYHWRIDQ